MLLGHKTQQTTNNITLLLNMCTSNGMARVVWSRVPAFYVNRKINPLAESNQGSSKINTYRHLSWRLSLRGCGKGWMAPCHDNMTEWDTLAWYWRLYVLAEQHYHASVGL